MDEVGGYRVYSVTIRGQILYLRYDASYELWVVSSFLVLIFQRINQFCQNDTLIKSPITIQVSQSMDDSSALLLNSDCRDQSDPTSCPNTWKYLDSSDGYAWKADSDLRVACGTKNVPNISSHQFLKRVILLLKNISLFPKQYQTHVAMLLLFLCQLILIIQPMENTQNSHRHKTQERVITTSKVTFTSTGALNITPGL